MITIMTAFRVMVSEYALYNSIQRENTNLFLMKNM